MKFEIIKDKFLQIVGDAERITSRHVSLPVLSCILLEATKGYVVVRSTNLDVGVECMAPAKVDALGKVAVSGALLKSFLANIPIDKNVLCELKGDVLAVEAGASKVKLKTTPYEDFPQIPKADDGFRTTMLSEELVAGIRAVWYSASISSIKPELSSIYIYQDQDDLVFVATDSFRLAEKRIKAKKVRGFESTLIPYKNASEILKILEPRKGEVLFVANKNLLSISAPDFHISSRLVDGNFPDYRQIIPKDFSTKVTALKQDLLQALKLSNLFADNFFQLLFDIHPSKKICTVQTKNNDIGESEQNLKSTIEGDNISLTFNLKYILDCMQSIPEESITLFFAGLGKPLLIKPAANNGSFLYLVMPMNR